MRRWSPNFTPSLTAVAAAALCILTPLLAQAAAQPKTPLLWPTIPTPLALSINRVDQNGDVAPSSWKSETSWSWDNPEQAPSAHLTLQLPEGLSSPDAAKSVTTEIQSSSGTIPLKLTKTDGAPIEFTFIYESLGKPETTYWMHSSCEEAGVRLSQAAGHPGKTPFFLAARCLDRGDRVQMTLFFRPVLRSTWRTCQGTTSADLAGCVSISRNPSSASLEPRSRSDLSARLRKPGLLSRDPKKSAVFLGAWAWGSAT